MAGRVVRPTIKGKFEFEGDKIYPDGFVRKSVPGADTEGERLSTFSPLPLGGPRMDDISFSTWILDEEQMQELSDPDASRTAQIRAIYHRYVSNSDLASKFQEVYGFDIKDGVSVIENAIRREADRMAKEKRYLDMLNKYGILDKAEGYVIDNDAMLMDKNFLEYDMQKSVVGLLVKPVWYLAELIDRAKGLGKMSELGDNFEEYLRLQDSSYYSRWWNRGKGREYIDLPVIAKIAEGSFKKFMFNEFSNQDEEDDNEYRRKEELRKAFYRALFRSATRAFGLEYNVESDIDVSIFALKFMKDTGGGYSKWANIDLRNVSEVPKELIKEAEEHVASVLVQALTLKLFEETYMDKENLAKPDDSFLWQWANEGYPCDVQEIARGAALYRMHHKKQERLRMVGVHDGSESVGMK